MAGAAASKPSAEVSIPVPIRAPISVPTIQRTKRVSPVAQKANRPVRALGCAMVIAVVSSITK